MRGFSLIELLIVITVLGVLGVVVSQSILVSIRTTNKTNSTISVREDVAQTVETMERRLLNAKSLDSACTDSAQSLAYTDQDGMPHEFSCAQVGVDGHIAIDGSRVTRDDVSITKCSFACSQPGFRVAPVITVNVAAESSREGIEGSEIELTSTVQLRALEQ